MSAVFDGALEGRTALDRVGCDGVEGFQQGFVVVVQLEVQLLADRVAEELFWCVLLHAESHHVLSWQHRAHRFDLLEISKIAWTGDVVAVKPAQLFDLDDDYRGVEERGLGHWKAVLDGFCHCRAVHGDDPPDVVLSPRGLHRWRQTVVACAVPDANGAFERLDARVFFQPPQRVACRVLSAVRHRRAPMFCSRG